MATVVPTTVASWQIKSPRIMTHSHGLLVVRNILPHILSKFGKTS